MGTQNKTRSQTLNPNTKRFLLAPLFLVALNSCSGGRNGDKFVAGSVDNLMEQPAGSQDAKVANTKAPDVTAQLDRIDRERREQDAFLKRLIDDEAEARRLADALLEEKIGALDLRVGGLSTKLDNEIKERKQADQAIELKIADLGKAFAEFKTKAEETYATKAQLKAVEDALSAFKETAALDYATKTELGKVKDDVTSLQKSDSATAEALKALDEKLRVLKETTEASYAKPEDVQNLKKLVTEYSSTVASGAAASPELQLAANNLLKQLGLLEAGPAELKSADYLQTASAIADYLALIKESYAATPEQSALVTRLTDLKLYTDLMGAIAAQLEDTNKRIDVLQKSYDQTSAELQAFKEFASVNFATKKELEQTNLVVTNLKNTTQVLGAKIDENHEDIKKRLNEEINKTKDALQAEIDKVQGNVDDLQGKLDKHIAKFEETVKKLFADASKEAEAVRALIAGVQSANEQSLLDLNGRLNGLTNRITNAELYAQDVRASLGDKINELSEKDNVLDAAVKAALKESSDALKGAIATEQAERDKLQKQINQLVTDVEKASKIANQALNQAQANDLALRGLSDELEKAKQNFKSELAQLRDDMNNKIGEVRQAAEDIAKDLGTNVQKQLAESVAGLADLLARDAAAGDEIARQISKVVPDANVVKNFREASLPLQQALLEKVTQFAGSMGNVEAEFLRAIDFVHGKAGVDNDALNTSFIALAKREDCQGITGLEPEWIGRNSSVAGSEWYFHMARAYAQLLLSGTRSGSDQVDKIFFGVGSLADGESLASAIAMQFVPSKAAAISGTCVAAINDWARNLLMSKGDLQDSLRSVLANDAQLRSVVLNQVKPSYAGLAAPSKALLDLIKSTTQTKLASVEAFNKFLNEDPAPGMIPIIAQLMEERAKTQYQIAATRANTEAITSLSRDVAKAQDKASNSVGDALARLDSKIQQMNSRIDTIVQDNDNRFKKLEGSVVSAFNLIAGIANRLGYADLVKQAREETGKIGGTINKAVLFPVECKATSHFFNFANEGQPLRRCDSGVNVGQGVIGDNGSCRTTVTRNTTTTQNYHTHTATTQVSYYANVNWVNTRNWLGSWTGWYLQGRSVYNNVSTWLTSQSVQTSETVKKAFVGVLKAPILNPEHPYAAEILARPEGAPFPQDRMTMLGLRIFGNAYYWKITDLKNQEVVLDAEKFRVKDAAAGYVFEIPASMFLVQNDGEAGFTETARVIALDQNKEPAGKQCLHSMNGGTTNTSTTVVNHSYTNSYLAVNYYHAWTQYYTSPLVLDLSGKGKVETVSATSSSATFDLAGRGLEQRVGWIKPDAGFLALDLNGNGKIDSGLELFGDHTLLADGSRASNGYLALAQYDSDHNGAIDAKDPVFKNLRVWVDANSDGTSQANELKSLQEVHITGISVKYSDVPLQDQTQHFEKKSKNLLLYQARFWGPENCPSGGCKSYDIYFGADLSVPATARK